MSRMIVFCYLGRKYNWIVAYHRFIAAIFRIIICFSLAKISIISFLRDPSICASSRRMKDDDTVGYPNVEYC